MKYNVILDRTQMINIKVDMKLNIERDEELLITTKDKILISSLKEDITNYKTIINAINYAMDNETVILN